MNIVDARRTATWKGLGFILIVDFLHACTQSEATDFKLAHCGIGREAGESSTLTFKSTSDGTRTIIFMESSRAFALRWSTGKFVLHWDNVLAVQIKPVQADSDARILSLRYKYPNDAERAFEGGVIDRACLESLRARYGAHLKFEEI